MKNGPMTTRAAPGRADSGRAAPGQPGYDPLADLTPRARQIIGTARELLEAEGAEALTVRALADRLGIRAPSLYKHVSGKDAVAAALISVELTEMGTVGHATIRDPGPSGAVAALARVYRAQATANPNLYRLATVGPLPRRLLPDGLEQWAGEPLFLATGEEHHAQALWAFIHGMVILEIDGRFPPGSDLNRTWAAGLARFAA